MGKKANRLRKRLTIAEREVRFAKERYAEMFNLWVDRSGELNRALARVQELEEQAKRLEPRA